MKVLSSQNWKTQSRPPDICLTAPLFSADRNSTEFDNSNPPSLQSIAVGPWKRTGDKQYAMLEVNQLFDDHGNFAGTAITSAIRAWSS
jgi:hypothetical protein